MTIYKLRYKPNGLFFTGKAGLSKAKLKALDEEGKSYNAKPRFSNVKRIRIGEQIVHTTPEDWEILQYKIFLVNTFNFANVA